MMPLPATLTLIPRQLNSVNCLPLPAVGSVLPVGVSNTPGSFVLAVLVTMIPLKLLLSAIVPLLWPAVVQAKPNGPVHPWKVRLRKPLVVVLKLPEPVVDVHCTLAPSVVVMVPPLPVTVKPTVSLRCQTCADAAAGSANSAAQATASPRAIIFLLMLYLSSLPRGKLFPSPVGQLIGAGDLLTGRRPRLARVALAEPSLTSQDCLSVDASGNSRPTNGLSDYLEMHVRQTREPAILRAVKKAHQPTA